MEMANVFMICYEVSIWIVSIAPIIIGLIFPCKAPFIGSIIYSEENCSGDKRGCGSLIQNMAYIMLTIINAIVHTKSVILGAQYAVFFLVPGILFLYRECHNFINQKKLKTLKFDGFRCLQVLEKIVNQSFQKRIYLSAVFLLHLLEILATVAVIKYWRVLNIASKIFYAIVGFDSGLVSIVNMSFSAKIYSTTLAWLKGQNGVMKFSKGKYGFKWERRFIRSCLPLRMRFGDNFVDVLTPLVMQNFCSSQIATLLLVGR